MLPPEIKKKVNVGHTVKLGGKGGHFLALRDGTGAWHNECVCLCIRSYGKRTRARGRHGLFPGDLTGSGGLPTLRLVVGHDHGPRGREGGREEERKRRERGRPEKMRVISENKRRGEYGRGRDLREHHRQGAGGPETHT